MDTMIITRLHGIAQAFAGGMVLRSYYPSMNYSIRTGNYKILPVIALGSYLVLEGVIDIIRGDKIPHHLTISILYKIGLI